MENIAFENFTYLSTLADIRHRRFQRGVRMDDHLRFHRHRIHGSIMATALYMSESCASVCISWFHQLLRPNASLYKFQPQHVVSQQYELVVDTDGGNP